MSNAEFPADISRSAPVAEREDPRLAISGLSKTYGQARVLRNAELTIQAGEIHGLLGANGSGKSTLVKCLTGVVAPDPGSKIALDGRLVEDGHSPTVMHELGIRVVHQDAPLIDGLAVTDSIALYRGYPLRGGMFTTSRAMRADAAEVLERLAIEIDPALPAHQLSAAERAMVMLALAVADVDAGCRLIVLDEPTASLPASDAVRFLEAMRQAAGSGVGVLLVTHRLAEVSEYCARLTVLRGGEVVGEGPIGDYSEERMVAEIVGPRPVDRGESAPVQGVERFRKFAAPTDREAGTGTTPTGPLLATRGLAGKIVRDVSFELAAGELIGVAGIVGSGASELGRLIAGVEPLRGGQVLLSGKNAAQAGGGIRAALAAGVAYVPGDRIREGGIPALSVADNLALPNFGEFCRRPRQARNDFDEVIGMLNVQPPDAGHPFGTLSGGNQQKVVIGKWVLTRPRLLVLDDPTAGVDPGAREDIYLVLRALAELGTGIVLVSSEPEQLVRLSRRVLVVNDGRIAAELTSDEVTVSAISRAAR